MNVANMEMPTTAYLYFALGGTNFTKLPPKYVTGFTYTRTTGYQNGNLWELNITLVEDLDFEETLLKELNKCLGPGDNSYLPVKFKYGYMGDLSPVYKCNLTGFRSSVSSGSIAITLSGQSYDNYKRRTKSFKNMYISDVVAQLFKLEGWKVGKIEPTKTKIAEIPEMTDVTTIDYINNKLCELAISKKTGVSGYTLRVDDSENGIIGYFTAFDASSAVDTATFVIGSGKYSNVISFDVSYEGGNLMGAYSTDAKGVDSDTNEIFHASYSSATNKNEKYLGKKQPVSVNSKHVINLSSDIPDIAKGKAQFWWSGKNTGIYDATLNIIGNPRIQPQSLINVIPVRRDGKIHHTAGLYRVKQITDTIQGGVFQSSLSLVKNGDSTVGGTVGGFVVQYTESSNTDTSTN